MDKFFLSSLKKNNELYNSSNKYTTYSNMYPERLDGKSQNKTKKKTRLRDTAAKEVVDQCCICYEKFKSTDMIKQLGCKHYFHVECINKWLTKDKHHCPYCRSICLPY